MRLPTDFHFYHDYLYKNLYKVKAFKTIFPCFYGGKILLKLRRNNFLRGEMGEKYGKLSAKLLQNLSQIRKLPRQGSRDGKIWSGTILTQFTPTRIFEIFLPL
jgi:hypothetical protein